MRRSGGLEAGGGGPERLVFWDGELSEKGLARYVHLLIVNPALTLQKPT